MSKLISTESVYWCGGNDRYIRVFKLGDEVNGINYMQGDDLNHFHKHYSDYCPELTRFYKAIKPHLDTRNSEIDDINAAIWAWVDYTDNY